MRKLFLLYVLFAFLSSCDKNDDKNCSGADCLPPVMQTGADTFGCLVNGEPFVNKSRSFNCFYQFVDGEYYFGIQGERNVSGIVLVGLGSHASQITINDIIPLNEPQPKNFYARINLANLGGSIRTTNAEDGSIVFTKFDMEKKIVSATFEFTVTDPASGKVYKITEGRFDTHFTEY